MATDSTGVFYVGGKLNNSTSPVFSCISRQGNNGLYLAKFIEQPDTAPTPILSQSQNTLTASPAFSGTIQWFLNGVALSGANSQTITATQTGNYNVSYSLTEVPACVSNSAVFVVSSLAVPNFDGSKISIRISPNPSTGIFNIQTENPIENATITVADLNGHIVYETKSENLDNKSLDLNHLQFKIYILNISNSTFNYSHKLVKQ